MSETAENNNLAQFKYTLKADSGYEAWGEAKITPEQYGRIMQIIHEPKSAQPCPEAAAALAKRLEATSLATCREAAAMIRQLASQMPIWPAQFLQVQELIMRLEAKKLPICNEAALLLRQLTPPDSQVDVKKVTQQAAGVLRRHIQNREKP